MQACDRVGSGNWRIVVGGEGRRENMVLYGDYREEEERRLVGLGGWM